MTINHRDCGCVCHFSLGCTEEAGDNALRLLSHLRTRWSELMELLWFLLIGLAAGWLAGQIMKGGGFGLAGDLIVGVIGAFLGGFLFSLLGIYTSGPIGSLITATVGAILLIVLLRFIRRGKR